ncbi:MAG: rod shape-determining protein RodA [Gammaproteobacteria bacterium]|nr:rod shape-determining protein RodA [Gammaproteobacteria bacterium]
MAEQWRSRNLLDRMHIDAPLLVALLAVCLIGLVVLYSASNRSIDVVLRQAIHFGIGLGVMLTIAQISPERLMRWAPLVYAGGVALLIAVMLVGTGRGAHRWLELGGFRFQPSEIMKLAVPLLVASYLRDRSLPPTATEALLGALIIAVPALLIAEQPDLGTALLVASSGMFVLFLAGLPWRMIGAVLALGVAIAPIAWRFMHDYQKQRVITLLDPAADPLGTGYHTIQGMIAVGSGGLYGKGWLNGTQSHLEFLPERATDFIFAVYCEEFGFVGVVVLLSAYALVIIRCLRIAFVSQHVFGRLLAASLTLTFFVYVFVNMGMVSGQLPVVGVPLPLISYGGTAVVTLFAGFGMVMSIQTHRKFIANI